jgi:hypothetical protein
VGKMGHLSNYEELCGEARRYYHQHKDAIESEKHERDRDIILEEMPKLQNVSIWCRNSEACREATHCEDLACDYKKCPADVVRGCAECQHFQVTTLSESWGPARHLFGFGKVTGGWAD